MLLLSGCFPPKKTSELGKKTIFDDPHFYFDRENFTLIRVNPERREEEIKEYLTRKDTAKTMRISPYNEKPKPDTTSYDAPPKPKKIVKPVYPRESLREKYHGTVFIKMLIDSTGIVLLAKPLDTEKTKHLGEGGKLLVKSALKAMIQSEFEPAIKNGKPVRVWVLFPVQFVIRNSSPKPVP